VVAASRPRTFDELYELIRNLPEGQRGEILTPGELHVTMGRPGRKHRRAAKALYVALSPCDADMGGTGWWVEIEAEVRLGDRLFDPDLAGWRVERVPELPEANPITTVPDWCCEVLSPSTTAIDVRTKLPHYLAAGVPFVWIVDPVGHLVEVFAPERGKPALVATASDEAAARLPPFDLDIDVRRLWTSSEPDE
jgi:Uma2 family endonuclease